MSQSRRPLNRSQLVHRRYGDLPPVLVDLLVDGSHGLRLLREIRLSLSVGQASLSSSLGIPSSPGAPVVLDYFLPRPSRSQRARSFG